ncbi:MAG: ABC transporter permease [Parasphingorhabdus sp.]|uniref:ABC transporter permease n=1 Tax=Parasphingorhabdus sp. TaxID=2709688 RepID=UPI003001DCE8
MATVIADKFNSNTESENKVSNNEAGDDGRTTEKAALATKAAGAGRMKYIDPKKILDWLKGLGAPAFGILAFLALWAVLAPQVDTSLGSLPGPVEVAGQGVALFDEWSAAQDQKAEFYAAQDARNAAAVESGGQTRDFQYSGPPTFLDQIWTSLATVALGFFLATIFAVPIGLICGLSKTFNAAINPLIQIMKPVSPLAWLPIVTMVISATMTDPDPTLPKSFVISAIVVMLCSLWTTLINTAIGAASIDKDLLNVGKVLRLGWFAKLTRLVLPSALPYIFTGMRLSLGVGWMVLIAAEMLAQNPGLGKFVWDEFQNGSSQSLARIMFAVIVIGLIGFMLDRVMMLLQNLASRNRTV